jgi:DNA-binding NarL/FixJ family response regulator
MCSGARPNPLQEHGIMNEKPIIRVLTVDDHPLMMAGIAGEINAQPDMRVVAQACDGDEAIAHFRAHRPDVTLMDIRMPKVNGIEAITAIRSEFPRARIVVLTTAAGDIQALRAFKAGASGYLLKTLLRTELIETIRMTHMGQRRIPPEIAMQLAEHAADDALTDRELEVLRGIAKGQSNKIIAYNLNIVEHTVKNHIKSILAKLDANDRTGAAMIAMRRGYIEAPDNS